MNQKAGVRLDQSLKVVSAVSAAALEQEQPEAAQVKGKRKG